MSKQGARRVARPRPGGGAECGPSRVAARVRRPPPGGGTAEALDQGPIQRVVRRPPTLGGRPRFRPPFANPRIPTGPAALACGRGRLEEGSTNRDSEEADATEGARAARELPESQPDRGGHAPPGDRSTSSPVWPPPRPGRPRDPRRSTRDRIAFARSSRSPCSRGQRNTPTPPGPVRRPRGRFGLRADGRRRRRSSPRALSHATNDDSPESSRVSVSARSASLTRICF